MKTILLALAALLPLAAIAAETVVVTVNGFGDTKAAAEKDAIRAAVRKVVGMLVDAETFVENDELISEKILTASNGFVTDYEIAEGPFRRKDGTIRVRIRATVEKGRLEPKVRAATGAATSGPVDGRGLFSELVTRQDAMADARAMLTGLFENVPQKLLVAELVAGADGKPIMILDARTGRVRVDVRVRVDHEAYGKWTSELKRFCDGMCSSESKNGDLGIVVPRTPSAYDFGNFVPAPDRSPPPMQHAISETWVDHSALKSRNLEYHGYCFSKDLLPEIVDRFRGADAKARFSVAVLSADGTVLSEREGAATFKGDDRTGFVLMTPHSWGASTLHLVIPGWCFSGSMDNYIGSACTMPVELGPFSEEAFRSADRFECGILSADPRQPPKHLNTQP